MVENVIQVCYNVERRCKPERNIGGTYETRKPIDRPVAGVCHVPEHPPANVLAVELGSRTEAMERVEVAPTELEKDESPSTMAATSGRCGKNVTWKLDSKGTLTISGKGAMKNWLSEEKIPWYSKRGSIKTIVIKNGVTNICDYAFENCKKLTKVKLTNSITKIGSFAFAGCSKIKRIKIPNKVTDMGGIHSVAAKIWRT